MHYKLELLGGVNITKATFSSSVKTRVAGAQRNVALRECYSRYLLVSHPLYPITFTILPSTMFTTTSRIMYDTDFVELGCPSELFDPITTVDNTIGTYATNFAIAVVCLVVAWMMRGGKGSKKENTNNATIKSCDPLITYYFLSTAISFLIAGISHVVVQQKSDMAKPITERFAYFFHGVASILLVLYGMKVLGVSRTRNPKKVYWWVVTLILTIIVMYAVIVNNLTFVGVLGIVASLFIAVVYVGQICKTKNGENEEGNEKTFYVVKALGAATMIGGNLIQLILAPKCGDAAYEECFVNCPLPDPTVFNHNGLFHVVFLIGLMILAFGEISSPSSVEACSLSDVESSSSTVQKEDGSV